jgi:hypothetical protein
MNTYVEHASHIRHRARVPSTDGLIEGSGILQRSECQMVVRGEWRYRSEGTGDGRRHRHGATPGGVGRSTYVEHGVHVHHRACIPLTHGLVVGKHILQYSGGRMAAGSERRYRSEGTGDAETTCGLGGTRTANMALMVVTELVSQVDKFGLNVAGSETLAPVPEPASLPNS